MTAVQTLVVAARAAASAGAACNPTGAARNPTGAGCRLARRRMAPTRPC